MGKEIIYGSDVLKRLESGIDKVANAVKITVGPRGQNVILQTNQGSPTITNDGVTIAREIQLEDNFENMGAQLMIEVASKANDVAGDGTTTATILGQAIFKEGLKNVVAGANPMAIKRGINFAVEDIVKALEKDAIKVEDKIKITQVATISANNDSSIAIEKVGKDGVITVEESKTFDTTLEVVEGMQFDKGFLSPYFANNPEGTEASLLNPFILVTDKKISNIKDLIPTLEEVAKTGRPLLIIAEDVDGEALATLIVNKMRGTISVVAVKAPDFGDGKKAILEDIAILTGANFITDTLGNKLENVKIIDLGTAKSVRITKDETTIIEGIGSKEKIDERIIQLTKQVDLIENQYEQHKMRSRIGKLSSGVAVIYAGAATETELKEKRYRIEDALHATRAAVAEGIVAGGGLALIKTIKTLVREFVDQDESNGYNIVKKAINSPLKQIAINAGLSGDVVLDKIDSENNIGLDANSLTFVNMFDAGIVDPLKITKSAIQNAASISGMLLTTGCMVAVKNQEEKKSCNC
jgi:chaperonin GroEL